MQEIREIRELLRGLDAVQIGEAFGRAVQAAYETCRRGAHPLGKYPKGGVRYMAALEAMAQHQREWRLERRIRMAREAAQ